MKKVLLLSPPYLPRYMRNARCDFVSLSGTQWFPILLGYCGAFLESKGFDIKLIDSPAYGLSFKDVGNIYNAYKPDFLVVYAGDKSRDSDIAFTDSLLSAGDIPAVFAGPYYSMDSAYFLKNSKKVTCGIRGEFELPVLEWLEGRALNEIKNLSFKNGDKITDNDIRPYLTGPQLEAIPFVSDFFSRHLDLKYYRTPSEPHPFVDILTGRGCKWGVCTFCLWVNTYVKGSVYNKRSVNNVMEELEFIEKKVPGVKSIMIQDDTFPQDRIIEFCNEKIKRGIKIKWSCYARADIELNVLLLMKKAGCLNLHVGFESANDEVLKNIKKGLTRERMTRFAADARTAGLRIHGDFLIGLPGEDENSIRGLIRWASTIRPYSAQFQVFIPFKGTPIYESSKKASLPDGRAEYLSKLAYRKFYFSLPYLLQVLRDPVGLFFGKLGLIRYALPSILWRRMNIR